MLYALNPAFNARPGTVFNLGARSTSRYLAWQTVTFHSEGGVTYFISGMRLPVLVTNAPTITVQRTGTNVSVALDTVGGLRYGVTAQDSLATNAVPTVLTNFLGSGSNMVVNLPATNRMEFFRGVILPD